MPIADTMKAIARGVGMMVPGVSDEMALQTATNARQRTALGNMIENAWRHETDPSNFNPNDPETKQRILSLQNMQNDLQKLGPFESPKKIQAAYGEYVSNHPMALGPVAAQPQGPTAVTGPAAPGNTPGKPNIIPSIDDAQRGGLMNMNTAGTPPTPPSAAPGTSPVQPSQQQGQGGGSSQTTAAFPGLPQDSGAGSDQGDLGAPASFSVTKTGVGETPQISMPQLPTRPIPALPGAMYTGTPELAQTQDTRVNAYTQLAHPAVQAQAAVDQALATARSTAEFQNANGQHKIAILKDMVGQDTWDALPPMAQTDIIADALGMKLSGMGSLYTPHTLSTGALGADLKKSNPGLKTESGGEMDDGTLYDEKIIAGKAVAIPLKPETTKVATAGGQEGIANPLNPAAGVTPIPGTAANANFGTYLQTYMKNHNYSNLTPFIFRQALEEYRAAGQLPPQNLALVPNDQTGQWEAQVVRPGTKLDPRAITVGGLSTWNTPTAAVRTQGQLGQVLVPEGESIKQEVQQVSDVIGPLMGRGYKFAVNKVGADFPQFANLNTKLDAFVTAFMKAHGIRSNEMHNGLLKQLTEAQSPDDLIARIDGLEDYLKGYTRAAGAGRPGQILGVGETPAPGAPAAAPKKQMTRQQFLDGLRQGK